MTREDALKISDALIAAKIGHTITVSARDDRWIPPMRWGVKITPLLVFSPVDIRTLQAVAEANGRGIAWIGGSFEFTEKER